MASIQLGHVTNAYNFISNSISPITIKRGRMVDHDTLILLCRNDDITTTGSSDQHLCLYFTSISPVTTKI